MKYSIKDEFEYTNTNNETVNNYIDCRLIKQIEWYDSKSTKYQKIYKSLSIISIVLSALIPVFTLALDLECELVIRFIIASLGSVISIISGVMTLNKYRELWIQYRTNCEILKSVLHRYYTKSGEFNSKDEETNIKMLVTLCEQYFTKEFDSWNNINSTNQISTGS